MLPSTLKIHYCYAEPFNVQLVELKMSGNSYIEPFSPFGFCMPRKLGLPKIRISDVHTSELHRDVFDSLLFL